jgi:hypothetical protein
VWIYVQWPPSETVEGFYALFAERPLLWLVSLDLLYIVNNSIVLLLYLALFTVSRPVYPSTVTIGLLLGAVGMAAYMASNRSLTASDWYGGTVLCLSSLRAILKNTTLSPRRRRTTLSPC